jgi:hypothetical protein
MRANGGPAVKKSLSSLLLLLATSIVVFAQRANSNVAAQTKRVAPRTVTGHYRLRSRATPNSLEVLQLPGGKIKFHILALWVSSLNRENVHNGEAGAIVDLTGDTAVYEAEHCKITIKFTKTSAIVRQADDAGDCDFGANVTATGTYRKQDRHKPKFDF